MKKLLIAAAIICTVAMSHAATIRWMTGTVSFNGEGSTLFDNFAGWPVAEGAQAYLFTGIVESYAAATALGSEGLYNAFTANGASSTLTIGGKSYTATSVKEIPAAGAIGFFDQDIKQGGNEYAAIIITYTNGGKDYYSANTMEVLDVALAGATAEAGLAWGDGDYWNPDNTLTTWNAASSPTPTPEPTSGLLLLLGVAGLALRRRRA